MNEPAPKSKVLVEGKELKEDHEPANQDEINVWDDNTQLTIEVVGNKKVIKAGSLNQVLFFLFYFIFIYFCCQIQNQIKKKIIKK